MPAAGFVQMGGIFFGNTAAGLYCVILRRLSRRAYTGASTAVVVAVVQNDI